MLTICENCWHLLIKSKKCQHFIHAGFVWDRYITQEFSKSIECPSLWWFTTAPVRVMPAVRLVLFQSDSQWFSSFHQCMQGRSPCINFYYIRIYSYSNNSLLCIKNTRVYSKIQVNSQIYFYFSEKWLVLARSVGYVTWVR